MGRFAIDRHPPSIHTTIGVSPQQLARRTLTHLIDSLAEYFPTPTALHEACDRSSTRRGPVWRVIRYVLVVALVVTVLAIAAVGVEYAATTQGEQRVEGAIASIESEATALYDEEDPAGDDMRGATRFVDIDLPEGDFASAPVKLLRFERVSGTSVTTVTYRVDGGPERTKRIDAPLETVERGPFDVSRETGTVTVHLERDVVNGEDVVVASLV